MLYSRASPGAAGPTADALWQSRSACTGPGPLHPVPDLAEVRALTRDRPQGTGTFLGGDADRTLCVLADRILDPSNEGMPSMLLELLTYRYGHASTAFCTQ